MLITVYAFAVQGVNENLLAAAKAGKAAEVRKLLATSGVNVTVRDGVRVAVKRYTLCSLVVLVIVFLLK